MNTKENQTENVIVNLTFEFALKIIIYCELLKEERKYEITKQLFRSGTSIGANVKEAQGAESKNDFIHKLKIASKEAEETEYWLFLCEKSKGYPPPEQLLNDLLSIKKVLGKIISTSKKFAHLHTT